MIDRQAVLARFGGDADFLAQVAALFRQSAIPWLQEMRTSRERGDFPSLKRVAHTLKGSVGNFLARDAAAAALHVQELADARDVEHIDAALATLDTAVQQLLEDLTDLIATVPAK
jgi:HPt (histidine-containing phosphotransfer) domain-containing protein